MITISISNPDFLIAWFLGLSMGWVIFYLLPKMLDVYKVISHNKEGAKK